jgi:hypothetical protein
MILGLIGVDCDLNDVVMIEMCSSSMNTWNVFLPVSWCVPSWRWPSCHAVWPSALSSRDITSEAVPLLKHVAQLPAAETLLYGDSSDKVRDVEVLIPNASGIYDPVFVAS